MKKARLAQNALALSALLTWLAPCPEAQTVTPTSIQFEVTADSLTAPIFPGIVGSFGVTSPAGTGWQYLGNQGGQNQPDFIVVSPSHGASSSVTFIGLNPNVFPYLRPGNYGFSAEFGLPGQALPSTPGPVFVVLTVDPPPPPVVSSVVSAASLQPQIAPGELISIFGANIGTPPVSSQYNDAGLYPTTLGNTTVTIGGTAAPLLYVNQTQINAVVPFEVAGQQSVNVVVTHDSVAAPTFSVPIAGTAPAMDKEPSSRTAAAQSSQRPTARITRRRWGPSSRSTPPEAGC